MGPCGPGGDYMREGHSMTHCTYCGEGYAYGSVCSCQSKKEKTVKKVTSRLKKSKK